MGDSPASEDADAASSGTTIASSAAGPEVADASKVADASAAGAGSDKKKAAACKFINSTLKSLTELSTDSECSAAAASGGRRRKRSMRKGRRSSKGGRRSRARKGSKGRKSRGRARTIKGGTKMTKELKAWMDRQKKATGLTAISKKTIAATKTKSQATGSEQRSESGKHVVAQARGL